MNKNLEDAVFRKMYKIKENPKVTVELYQSESRIEFFIPIVNEDKFFVYSYISMDGDKIDAEAAHKISDSIGVDHSIINISSKILV